jgi:Mechanosensitive ion channel, conserved TM helix
MTESIMNSLKQMLDHLTADFEHFLPRVLVMLVIIIVGWLIAILLKVVVRRALALAKFDALSESAGTTQLLRNAALPAPRDLVARLTFWVVWIVFLLLGINALGVVSLGDQISQLLLFLPQIFVAVLILFVGFLLANFLARATLLAAVNANLPFARLLAGSVRFLLVLLTVSMALEQITLAHRTVLIAFTILFGAVMLALAIAFGIAGQHLARQFLQKSFSPAEPEKEEEITHL